MDLTARHPSTQAVMRFFVYDHLPEHLQAVSRPFTDLAETLLGMLPDDPELTTALRKLWEAKNSAVALASLTPR